MITYEPTLVCDECKEGMLSIPAEVNPSIAYEEICRQAALSGWIERLTGHHVCPECVAKHIKALESKCSN